MRLGCADSARVLLSRARCLAYRGFSLRAGVPQVLISTCHRPAVNLAFEDWLYKTSDPDSYLLFLYRNSPCVVIGRNQNPWTEINMRTREQLDVPLIRRRSGGGTVYHDLGNINYCLLSPREAFDRKRAADMVTRALNDRLDIPARVNERHDICVDEYKVSGSAFRIGAKRAYHHGTMLLDAAVNDLQQLLHSTTVDAFGSHFRRRSFAEESAQHGIRDSKGVASVPSPVRNLKEWNSTISHDAFIQSAAESFFAEFAGDGQKQPLYVAEEEMLYVDFVRRNSQDLLKWDWLYGQTPEFIQDVPTSYPWDLSFSISLVCKRGLITDLSIHADPSDVRSLSVKGFLQKHLPGDRYGSLDRTSAEAAKMDNWRLAYALEALLDAMGCVKETPEEQLEGEEGGEEDEEATRLFTQQAAEEDEAEEDEAEEERAKRGI